VPWTGRASGKSSDFPGVVGNPLPLVRFRRRDRFWAPLSETGPAPRRRKDPISKNLEKSSTFCEKSLVSSTPGSFIRPRWLLTEKYTEGLHPERPARGAVLYTGQFRPCIEHKGPPSTKNMHKKDGHDSRGRNYKAETQLPTFAWASLPI